MSVMVVASRCTIDVMVDVIVMTAPMNSVGKVMQQFPIIFLKLEHFFFVEVGL